MRFGFTSMDRRAALGGVAEGLAGRHYADPVEFILDQMSEALDCPGKGRVTKELRAAWKMWAKRVDQELEVWAGKHGELFAPSMSINHLDDSAYNVYSTLAGKGVGIWDGRWDHAFNDPETAIANLKDHLGRHLRSDFDTLHELFHNSACLGALNGV
jgi:hypothetical protein